MESMIGKTTHIPTKRGCCLLGIAVVALLSVSVSSAQSLVGFNTRILGPTAQVRDVNGDLLSGTSFFAQIYGAYGLDQPESALVAVGSPVNFRIGANAGYVQTFGVTSLGMPVDPTIDVYGSEFPPGGPATVIMRAWSGSFPTYGAALAGGGQYGSSLPLNMPSTGVTEGNLMIGLQGFSLVPEPPAWSLGLLGALALWGARRWRKAQSAWKT